MALRSLRPNEPLVPGDPNPPVPPDPPQPITGKRKRTQVLAACSNCQKQKSKCDGERPTCGACESRNKECHYSVPEGLSSRNEQRRRFHTVAESYENLRTAFGVLRRSDEEDIARIIRRIRESATTDEAIEMIANIGLLLSRSQDTGSASSSGSRTASPGVDDAPRQSSSTHHSYAPGAFGGSFQARSLDDLIVNVPMPCLPVSKWTSVSEDDVHLTHLINLFWTWDNTASRVIDREIFIEDLTRGPGTGYPATTEFCSSFMVNALLALACTYSTQDKIFAVPGDLLSRGRVFADEATRIYKLEKHQPSLPLFQGTVFLWIYEAITNDGAFGLSLLENTYKLYSGFQFNNEDEVHPPSASMEERRRLQAISHMVWGYYCVVSKVELTFSRPMRVSKPGVAQPLISGVTSSFGNHMSPGSWFAYPMSLEAQVCSFREVFLAECALAELSEEILLFREGHQMSAPSPATLAGVEKLWHKLAHWKMFLQESLQYFNTNVPSVLILHITHSSMILKLVEGLPSTPGQTIGGQGLESLRISHATSVMAIVWTFRSSYTFHHEYWAMQSCFAAAIAVLEYLEPGTVQVDTFVRACQALSEMGEYLSFANSLLAAIQSIIARFKISLPPYGAKYLADSKGKQADIFTSSIRVSARLPGRRGQNDTADMTKEELDHLEVEFCDLILHTDRRKVEVD
ncbi:Nitrogen assimilation transcription factor nit-4-like protein [Cladobotryum mycophilum]|uniref:Nitrogen assimilation transcription factor nit-4-like protein n=1 Tax=Cladobotryum mycophilum TaxID=491253 RepID=A0ABR0S7W2_9HYPO